MVGSMNGIQHCICAIGANEYRVSTFGPAAALPVAMPTASVGIRCLVFVPT
jgi:hypothetical protein